MLVPLYGFVEGDTMGVVVLAHRDMTFAQVAEKLAASASSRVDTGGGGWTLWHGDVALLADETVERAGLPALCRIDLRRRR
jgi:hypothetical protein